MAQEMLEKNGFVGSGIICLNAQILSKSSSIRFEKRTLGGTRKARLRCLAFSVFGGRPVGLGTGSFATRCCSVSYNNLDNRTTLFNDNLMTLRATWLLGTDYAFITTAVINSPYFS